MEKFDRLSFEALEKRQKEEKEKFINEAHELALQDDIDLSHEEGLKDNADFDEAMARVETITGKKEMEMKMKIILEEEARLSKFFGQSINVPPLPVEITKEKLMQWEKQDFELRYLPDMEMAEKDNDGKVSPKKLDNWQYPPQDLFDFINDGKVDADATMLKSGWLLVDKRRRPNYGDGQSKIREQYKNDVLAEMIKKLRKDGIIRESDWIEADSRFDFVAESLDKIEVKQAFADVLGVRSDQIDLFRAIEWNVVGNKDHLEWYSATTTEWLKDEVRYDESGKGRLVCDHDADSRGINKYFPLSFYETGGAGHEQHHSRLGFRPLVRF